MCSGVENRDLEKCSEELSRSLWIETRGSRSTLFRARDDEFPRPIAKKDVVERGHSPSLEMSTNVSSRSTQVSFLVSINMRLLSPNLVVAATIVELDRIAYELLGY
jgi:hypothetical protein